MKRLFLGVFGGFCVVIVCIGLFNFIHFSKLHAIQQELVRVDEVAQELQHHKEALQSFGQHRELFDRISVSGPVLQTANDEFWKETHTSLQQIAKRKSLPHVSASTEKDLQELRKLEDELIIVAGKIGFKDFGLIGRLRTKAHAIEEEFPQFKARLLSLRRHEKDFLMRTDPMYVKKMHEEIGIWKAQNDLPEEVIVYSEKFDSLAEVYLQLFHKTGLYSSWNLRFDQLQGKIRDQRSALLRASFSESAEAQSLNVVLNSVAILIALFCTIYFTRKFSMQVIQLQKSMKQYIAENYNHSSKILLKIPKNEFGKITVHFLQLTRKIKEDMHLLEDRVARRTRALEVKNTQLEMQHSEMMDSLRYARDLQQSMLVSHSRIRRSFKEAYVHYQPKSIVGGDFYWLKETKNENVDRVYIALADCTGHGVPGALLSVMGMNALDELVDSGVGQPAELLNELRSLITRRLNTHEDKRYDGMDLALFMLDRKTNELTFAGAQMPLWIVSEFEITELKGQRMPIGYTFFETSDFQQQTIKLRKNDKILLFTDGVVDQFGGPDNRKMGKKNLRELLLSHSDEPAEKLFSSIKSRHQTWKAEEEQTDDCTFILLEANPLATGVSARKGIEKNGSSLLNKPKSVVLS